MDPDNHWMWIAPREATDWPPLPHGMTEPHYAYHTATLYCEASLLLFVNRVVSYTP